MVPFVIRLTAAAVLALALANAGQGLWLALRFARCAHRRLPGLGARMWLPLFASRADVRDWLLAWRTVLTCQDAAIRTLRLEARHLITRHLLLGIGANGWAVAVWAILLLPLA